MCDCVQRHTKGKMKYSTGQIYDGEFVNDVICGEGEMRYSSSCKYQGSWMNGLVSCLALFCASRQYYTFIETWIRCNGVF